MSLSKAQENAVSHNLGPMLVLAGPGSGKTTVITHRVRNLVECCGIEPSKILVISFTKASAVEMKERFLKLMNVPHTLASFGTFHSIFLTILKQSFPNGNFHIIAEKEKQRLLQRLIKVHIKEEDQKEGLSDSFLKEISFRKNQPPDKDFSPVSFCSEEDFQTIFQSYQTFLKKEGQLDFDDILKDCYQLLKDHPQILAFWQNHFSHILIDEFQDINPIQFETIRLLAAPKNNLFVVGDDDQAIYGFRGASPEIMLHFSDYFPDSKQILLDTNYRCHPEIVHASLKLISHNKERYEKDIKSRTDVELSEKSENCSQIFFHTFETQQEEFAFLTEHAQQTMENGMTYEDMAILFRQQSAVEPLLFLLRREGIPFTLKGASPKLLDHWITKDLLAYFSLAYGEGSRQHFLQILEKPPQGIYRSDLKPEWNSGNFLSNFYEMDGERKRKLELFARKLDFLSSMPFPLAFSYVKKAFGYEACLKNYAKSREMELSDLLSVIDTLEAVGREAETFDGWLEFLEENPNGGQEEKEKGIALMTFHGSKGLEFKQVYLIDTNEGITPHQKALTEQEIEEERRMFYVAVTRAKEKLILCHANRYYNKKLAPSRFLAELKGEQDIQTHIKTTLR